MAVTRGLYATLAGRAAIPFAACAIAALASACSKPTPSGPTAVQLAAQAFGLMGSWADDCSPQPATFDAGMMFADESDGTVSLAFDDGHGTVTDRYRLTQGQVIAPDQIQFDADDNGVAYKLVLQKSASGQLRVFDNIDGTGKVLVQNATFPSGGGPNWQNKCS